MRKLPALLVLVTATVAGCGGSGPTARVDDGVVRVTLEEYRLVPETIVVPAGTVRLVARDGGRLTHNLAVQALDRRAGEERREYARTPTAHPGDTVETTVDLRPGTYRLSCTLANHDDLGMYGELQVTGG